MPKLPSSVPSLPSPHASCCPPRPRRHPSLCLIFPPNSHHTAPPRVRYRSRIKMCPRSDLYRGCKCQLSRTSPANMPKLTTARRLPTPVLPCLELVSSTAQGPTPHPSTQNPVLTHWFWYSSLGPASSCLGARLCTPESVCSALLGALAFAHLNPHPKSTSLSTGASNSILGAAHSSLVRANPAQQHAQPALRKSAHRRAQHHLSDMGGCPYKVDWRFRPRSLDAKPNGSFCPATISSGFFPSDASSAYGASPP
ncbi:hypothetical protein BS50DRAFT_141133 [Corynespora cassiicola Philippines]|uniref:Uncharacterized protein n=1 Tax=Corynespora cassiicola Philippines TaxID=1448308 RepID=A0A2T2N9Y3_CORCC|nr:hypothetical protein BS50DRAFT_141133 [Corynespora cassiicola Philippines]